jgi:hypothetical protein
MLHYMYIAYLVFGLARFKDLGTEASDVCIVTVPDDRWPCSTGGINEVLKEIWIHAPIPLCPPQIPYRLPCDMIRSWWSKVLICGTTKATTSCMDGPRFYSQPGHWQPVLGLSQVSSFLGRHHARTYHPLSRSLTIKNNKSAQQNLLTVQNPTCQSVSQQSIISIIADLTNKVQQLH